MGIDSAKLDRILEYLEISAKVSTGGGPIRWVFKGACAQEDSNTDGGDNGPMGDTSEESEGILTMAERLSADLDNDRPYNEDIQRRIADCEAGRPIGKTYTGEEYLRYLDQEFGNGALEHPE